MEPRLLRAGGVPAGHGARDGRGGAAASMSVRRSRRARADAWWSTGPATRSRSACARWMAGRIPGRPLRRAAGRHASAVARRHGRRGRRGRGAGHRAPRAPLPTGCSHDPVRRRRRRATSSPQVERFGGRRDRRRRPARGVPRPRPADPLRARHRRASAGCGPECTPASCELHGEALAGRDAEVARRLAGARRPGRGPRVEQRQEPGGRVRVSSFVDRGGGDLRPRHRRPRRSGARPRPHPALAVRPIDSLAAGERARLLVARVRPGLGRAAVACGRGVRARLG